jgi:hypothetical protein
VKPDWLTIPAAEFPRQPRCAITQCRVIVFGAAAVPAAVLTTLAQRYSSVDLELLDPHPPTAPRQPLDKHRLDVALSVGRHAVERAQLAGCQMVLCVAVLPPDIKTPLAQDDCASGVCYQWLCAHGTAELAALIGARIASAQLGLYSPSSIAFMLRRIRPCLSTSNTLTRT